MRIGFSSAIRGTRACSSSRSIPRDQSTPPALLWDTEPLAYWRVKMSFDFGWGPTPNTIGWFRSCAAANYAINPAAGGARPCDSRVWCAPAACHGER